LSKVETAIVWGPDVVGSMKLDERRWAVGVHAPFDMPVGAPDLMGTKVYLDGKLFEIRGIVPNVPLSTIKAGQLLELLVVAL
jgi:ribosomal protein L1